jgi:hypothetical protein
MTSAGAVTIEPIEHARKQMIGIVHIANDDDDDDGSD